MHLIINTEWDVQVESGNASLSENTFLWATQISTGCGPVVKHNLKH